MAAGDSNTFPLEPPGSGSNFSTTAVQPIGVPSLTWPFKPFAFNNPGGVPDSPGYTYLPNPNILDDAAPTTPAVDGKELGLTAASRGAPVPYAFGRTLVTPQIIAAETVDDYIIIDYLVGVGLCEEFEYVLQGNENVELPAGWEFFLGTAGQAASTLMTTAKGGSYDALPNICHFVGKFEKEDSIDVKVMGKWLHLFDPRTSPQAQAYSNNPALALARIFDDSGYTVDWDSVATLADYCAEDVDGAPRWTVDLPLVNRAKLSRWAHVLAQYCGGAHIDIQGGQVSFIPDRAVTTSPVITHTVTAEDVITARTKKVGTRKVPNKVIVHYQEDTGARRSAAVGSGTTGDTTRLQMPGFSSYTMAARFATQTRNKARADLHHDHIAFDAGLEPTKGDLVDITFAPHGLAAKRMRLLAATQSEIGRWQRSYVEYDAVLYSDNVFVEPSIGDTDLGNPNVPPAGPTPTAVEELWTDETATTYSRLRITFTGVSWPWVQAYKVTADGEQNVLNVLVAHDGPVIHTVYTSALKQGVTYTIETKVQSITGVLSTVPGTTSVIAVGKLLPPGDVPWLNVTEVGGFISAQWGAAEEIDGDLRGYTLKLLAAAYHTGTAADWTNVNAIVVAQRLDAQSLLTVAPGAGDFYLCIKAIDSTGTESDNALCGAVTVTTDAWATNTTELETGVLTNMHAYTIDGAYSNAGKYVITSTGETWADRFGATSPEATWGDAVTSSPAERWGGDLATDSLFESAVWDYGSLKDGNWWFSDENVTLLGGTQLNQVSLGNTASPIVYTDNAGNRVQATARYMKAKVSTTDSPASAGDGLHIKLPIQVSQSGEVVPQSGSVTIADDSPLDNPKSVVFTSAYANAPRVTLTPSIGSPAIPLIALSDNISTTGFDIWLFDTAGNKVAGTVYWSTEGT